MRSNGFFLVVIAFRSMVPIVSGDSVFKTDCTDSSSACPSWASSGECSRNPSWMMKNCQLSCNVCECKDDSEACPSWAEGGECTKNPSWMKIHCKRSCKACSGPIPSPTPWPTPPPTPRPTLRPSPTFDSPSDWYYKSWHACTSSDSPSTKKCSAAARSWQCYGDVTSLSCDESDKMSCGDMGRASTSENPDGFGFMCPHLMLGSAEMVNAAKADGYDGAYAVVTIDALKCGQCVKITNTDAESFPNAPEMIGQVFNSVAAAVDVYMVGGGLGANNGCQAVGGKPNMASMYKKYPTAGNTEFVEHLKSLGYPNAATILDQVVAYQGGIRGGKNYADCLKTGKSSSECQPPGNGCDGGGGICMQDPAVTCPIAYEGNSEFVTQKAMESCHFVFEHDLHWNRPITYEVVDCPAGLTALTGLRPMRAMNTTLGAVRVNSQTTTMEDCCEPSCSREPFVSDQGGQEAWEPGFDAMYTCNAIGERYTMSKNPMPDPCESTESFVTV